jgi:hypothetical protein
MKNVVGRLLQRVQKLGGKKMEEIAVGAIIKRITSDLAKSRDDIKKWSDEIADKEHEAAKVMDAITLAYSSAFTDAARAMNDMGKLLNPNIDAQKASAYIALNQFDGYGKAVEQHRQLQEDIQILKNSNTKEHEKRGDLKTEVELLKLIDSEGA